MLTRYQQQTKNRSFNHNIPNQETSDNIDRLNISYDLNNYQPLLSHLQISEDPRWILFIAPPGKPNFQFLQQSGINKSRVITLTQKQLENPEEIFKNALSSNNYAAVIHWTNSCDVNLQKQINELTAKSQTQCFVYCSQ